MLSTLGKFLGKKGRPQWTHLSIKSFIAKTFFRHPLHKFSSNENFFNTRKEVH